MLAMAKLGGIKSKIPNIILVALVGCTLSGCTSDQLDLVRPEVNNSNGMVVFPNSYYELFKELEDLDGSGDSTEDESNSGIGIGGGGGTGEPGGTLIGDSASFDALPYNVVSAPDYNTYLNEQVFTKVKTVLDGLENGGPSQLYFRVFHSGYTVVADDTTAIQKASIYDNRSIGTGSVVYGTVFPNLAYYWLGKSDDNIEIISRARNSYMSLINNSNFSPRSTWVNASSVAGSNLSYLKIIKMWGNERFNAETLQDHLDDVRSTVIGTVPDITLKILLSSNSSTTVTLNPTNDVVGSRYFDHMSKTSVDRLFGSYNQYKNREQCKYDLLYADSYGLLFAYVDGYSKTIVSLCTMEDVPLEEILGEQYDHVHDIILGVYDYTQWVEISEFVEDATVLQAGTRGTN